MTTGREGRARRDWAGIGLQVGPVDRAAAEAGVRAAYRRAGLAEPAAVAWFESPLVAATASLQLTSGSVGLTGPHATWACAEARRLLAGHGIAVRPGAPAVSVRDAVRTAPWRQARDRLVGRLGQAGWSERWTSASGELWPRLHGLTVQMRNAVVDALVGTAESATPSDRARSAAVRLALLDAALGQQDAAWLAATDGPELEGLRAVAENAGWWWPYADVVLLTERPVRLSLDQAGRLHRADGPAVAWSDGFALHAWRGTPVPASLFERLGGLSADEVRAERNPELRRVMLEHFGYDRYLTESDAEPMHVDETGVLWRIELAGDEPLVMVEVVNSTPEPDGMHRVYWLRVPPTTRSAREGVAWTFGLPAEAYQPRSQT